MMRRLAVIVPSYRSERFLGEAIGSIVTQVHVPNLAVTIVVVAGTPEDARVARSLGLHPLVAEPTGISDARNRGIESVPHADWILPLDADDKIDPTALEDFVRHRPETEKPWIVTSDVKEFGDGEVYWSLPPARELATRNALSYASLYPRSLWAAAGGYDPNAHEWEDWDFWLRCRPLEPAIVQVRKPLLLYRRHADQKSQREKGRETEALLALRRRHAL